MANFTAVGVEDMLRSLERFGRDTEDAIPDMLNAGADVAQEAMESTTAWSDQTGQLRRSIKRTKVMGHGSGSYIDIYPSGKTPDGQRLEEIGFVLEYGRGVSSYTRPTNTGLDKEFVIPPMAPRPWLRPAIEDNVDSIIDAMLARWKESMGSGW